MIESIISAEFGVNLGQVVVETYKLIDEEPALAALSLSQLRGKLDSEGLPIDIVIEQLNILASSNENFLATFLLQLRSRLDEPNGLQILTDSIDDQGQEISEKIHQILDESVQSSLSIDKVGGGSGNMKHPWLAAGLTAAGVGGAVGVIYRRKVNQLERIESRTVAHAEGQSQEAAEDIFRDRTHLRNLYQDGNLNPVRTADRAEIVIAKDLKSYTDKEIEKLFKPFVDGAKERLNDALSGADAEEIKAVKLRMVDKVVLDDCVDAANRTLASPIVSFKGDTGEEQMESARKFIEERAAGLRSKLAEDPDLLDKYLDRRLLNPCRQAFDDAAAKDGRVILTGFRKQLDRDIRSALESAQIIEKRKAAAFEREVDRDFADLGAKIETRTDNLVKDEIGDVADAIDNIEIDMT